MSCPATYSVKQGDKYKHLILRSVDHFISELSQAQSSCFGHSLSHVRHRCASSPKMKCRYNLFREKTIIKIKVDTHKLLIEFNLITVFSIYIIAWYWYGYIGPESIPLNHFLFTFSVLLYPLDTIELKWLWVELDSPGKWHNLIMSLALF